MFNSEDENPFGDENANLIYLENKQDEITEGLTAEDLKWLEENIKPF